MLRFLERINPSSWLLSFGNKLSPRNKARWDPLERRGPAKGLQPSFFAGRTQMTQFCQDTFSNWACGQAFPSGFGCAKGGILCSSIPICPRLFSVTISSPTEQMIFLPHLLQSKWAGWWNICLIPCHLHTARGPGWGVALPCASPRMCWPGLRDQQGHGNLPPHLSTPWVQTGKWGCIQHVLVTLSGSGRCYWSAGGKACPVPAAVGKSLQAEVSVFSKCCLKMRLPAVAARMLLGQFLSLLSGHLIKCVLALSSLMVLAWQRSSDVVVSQAYPCLCGLGHVRSGGICSTAHLYPEF